MSSDPIPMVAAPFVPTATPAMERANRLMSVRTNPGFSEILRISQTLVDTAAAISIDYPGWDAQQITVLKCRAQAAKEHHTLLFSMINQAIQDGIEEGRALVSSLPAQSAEESVDQGDFVRQKVLENFDEMDGRAAGSY